MLGDTILLGEPVRSINEIKHCIDFIIVARSPVEELGVGRWHLFRWHRRSQVTKIMLIHVIGSDVSSLVTMDVSAHGVA